MKIILLSGKPNTGKTHALLSLYEKLKGNDKCDVGPKKQIYNGPDFECVLECKTNGKKGAIYSHGDTQYLFFENLIKYADRDILIIAYSQQFSYPWDEEVAKNPYHHVVEKKEKGDKDDDRVCAEIMKLLFK